jgi:hypothetical protein
MLCLTKNQYSWLLVKVYCLGVGQVSETICEAIDDELHFKGIENCCLNSDSPSVLGEEICGTPDFSYIRTFSIVLTFDQKCCHI